MLVVSRRHLSLLSCFIAGLLPLSARAAPVDFNREVQPILSDNCYRCHGPDSSSRKAGLRLDLHEAAFAGGKSGLAALVPGKPDESELIARIFSHDPEEIMPSPDSNKTLSAAQKDILRRWITEGAVWGEHWAYVAPRRPALPAIQNRKSKIENSIDAFIRARLAAEKITPAPEASRATLIRRVSLDLIGLPPTRAEVDAFVRDPRPDAYERLVDRLLASTHYGERQARPWLDVARYSDSNGYSIDAPRQIWKYRDWVVNALNRDQPYDQFVIEQLAGDLLPDPTTEQKIATGFNRNTQINQEGGIDPEQFRIESVMDRVATFGSAFLGLTINCAQCHDHKFDPIPQADYYRLFAFFNNTVDDGHGENVPGGRLSFASVDGPADNFVAEIAQVRADIAKFLEPYAKDYPAWRAGVTPEAREKFKQNVTTALTLTWDKQTLNQRRAMFITFGGTNAAFSSLNEKLGALEKHESKATMTLIMSELSKPRDTTIFIKGDFTRHGDKVTPGTLGVLPPLKATIANRLDLARWLFDPANPLTARVMVNRIWQQYFGLGLVQTENDFGSQGSPPTHPELLDWLATEFSVRKWSMKAMHRLIVTSATYRQSSLARPDLDLADPLNKLLARQNRIRLDAEIIRDVALSASGLYEPKLGGPPVFPPQPDGVMNLGQSRRAWSPSTGPNRYRRALYTHMWRATPHPAVAVFDAPDGFSACTRRLRSNTPLQALTLLNDLQFFEFAQALAARIEREGGATDAARLDYAFNLCTSRAPTVTERTRLLDLLRDLQQPAKAPATDPAATPQEAWIIVSRVLLNLDETITRA
ncbi:MAG: PSD1 domain-containing protein [Undibacterium sp.]|nr:PSD1 domain-containing protein [Opitutaceae bacterium]